jgi:drug/metabolite transporter (DMT)-like permease
MTASTKAYILLTITTLGWACNAAVGKMAVGHVSPLSLTLLRWCVALALIVAVSLPQLRQDWPLLRRHWLRLLSYGAIGFTGFNALLYSAVGYTSAMNVVIEQSIIPGIIFLGNFILFRTRVSVLQIIGYTITLAGVVVTASHGSLQALSRLEFNVGDLLMLCACILYATYTVTLRYKPEIHWKSLMAASAVGAMLAAAPLAAWEFHAGRFIAPDAIGTFAILFTGIVPSLVSQILYVRGIELIGPNRAGLFINLIPVFGTAIAFLVLREAFEAYHVVAMILVIVGIAFAERNRL